MPPQTPSGSEMRFDREWFTTQLAERTASELYFWASRWKVETIRALAHDCHPWHGGIGLCLLTCREEDLLEDEHGKWALGDWRLQCFTSSAGADGWPAVKDLEEAMLLYDQGKTSTDMEFSLEERAEVIFRCCANALLSEEVAESLKLYNLSEDFELGVFNPDDFNGPNYCYT